MLRESEGDVTARRVLVRGTIQGVGFRPFIYRLARRCGLSGWVRNAGDGVEIHVEGASTGVVAFLEAVASEAPPAADVAHLDSEAAVLEGTPSFQIISSKRGSRLTVRLSPDLCVCDACRAEMNDPADRRAGYPYINCTNCGPRYSIIRRLPYDRPFTTMADWKMCADCTREYLDPLDRRFHAQPTACPVCGPSYDIRSEGAREGAAVVEAADRLRNGEILAVKGIGGYHLACDAQNVEAVKALRERKFRKEKPFALMVRDLATVDGLVKMVPDARRLLESAARPIVLMPARRELPGVAPGIDDLGIMLPYTPLHHLLFDAGAPSILVMTSANRSSEPIAYEDDEAFEQLAEMADAFLVGERPIARRVDDSVAQIGPLGPTILRRSRGYAPSPAAVLPAGGPVLAVGADLKNAVTLVVDGEAFVSQHIGDLEHYGALTAFQETVEDLLSMYGVPAADLRVAHDVHPQYISTLEALEIGSDRISVQHHRAHVASVLAEHGAFEERVLGIALDGTGYGDDGAVWGGEFFLGSLKEGFTRIAHLREARLPGGDAAARHPVQAASGFLADLDNLPDLEAAPFEFPDRYRAACELLDKDVRVFRTTSFGRLFDTAAALCGFTRSITYEGQAAIWLEQLARRSEINEGYPFPELDFRPLLEALITDRTHGRRVEDIARAFHLGLAKGLAERAEAACEREAPAAIVLSGGVFQNRILLGELVQAFGDVRPVWTNHAVPCNDGGISLGQAAVASFAS